MTNYERITSESPEQFAKTISIFIRCSMCPGNNDPTKWCDKDEEQCVGFLHEWLMREVE